MNVKHKVSRPGLSPLQKGFPSTLSLLSILSTPPKQNPHKEKIITPQQRIAQSAAELGKLLRQAEKQHRRFLSRRDAKRQSIAPWTPEGHPLVFVVQSPHSIDVELDARKVAQAVHKAARVHGTEVHVPWDNGKPFSSSEQAELAQFRAESARTGVLRPQAESTDNHQEWVSYIFDAAFWQFTLSPDKLFAPIWRSLKFRKCPLSYSQALSVYNNAFQQLLSARKRGSYMTQKANNQL